LNQNLKPFNFLFSNHCNIYLLKIKSNAMIRQFLVLSVIITSLLLVPIASQNASAFKVTNQPIYLKVTFTQLDTTSLEALYDDLDDGLIEQNVYDVLSPVAVGQWSPSDIVADWGVSVNHNTGVHVLFVDPVITEINVANGVNFATINDTLVDDGRNIVTTKLANYGVHGLVTWELEYDGGLIVEQEILP